jgi:hypothetical protein
MEDTMITKIDVSRRNDHDELILARTFFATPGDSLEIQFQEGGVLCVTRTPFGPGAGKKTIERVYFSPNEYATIEPTYGGMR